MRRSLGLLGGVAAVAAVGTLASAAGGQVVAGQRDTFQNGTTQGWIVGDPSHPAPPFNVATGGPAGADDNYLRLTAIGGAGAPPSPGSRLAAFNTTQWTGNYFTGRVAGISMDVRNFGPSSVSLRLLFAANFGMMGPADVAFSTDAVTLAAGSDWTSVFFPIVGPGALSTLIGTAAGALSSAQELRIFHNPSPIFTGPPNSSPPVEAVVGIDNIAAVAIPEPSTVVLLGSGVLALAALRRRAARRRDR